MRTTNCEDILMAAMAVSDGEEPQLPIGQIEGHIAGCEHCRSEIAQMESLMQRLANYERQEVSADLLPAISGVIAHNEIKRWSRRGVLAVFAAMLVIYKLVEMLPDSYPGHILKIAPVIAAAALFMLLKENPFKINTELTMEQ